MRGWRSLILCSLVWKLLLGTVHASDRTSVVFLEPDDSRFWALLSGFMRAVAEDLDLELEVITDYERHRLSYQTLAERVLARPNKPDYLVFICRENVTARMLTMAHDAGVKVFTFNTDIPVDAREEIGLPRGRLANWIGHVSPDNVGAGRVLARLLAQRARGLNEMEHNGPPSMMGLSGTRDSSSSIDRNLGLIRELNTASASLTQLVHADWSVAEARDKSAVLLKRYPQTAAIWSASDGMALGAIDAAKSLGRQPGVDLVVGGVDWEPRALDAIRQGDMAVSLGRHFMGGGLLLLLLHDYQQGHDFVIDTPVLHYDLEPATRANIARVERILDPLNWQRVNFRNFSRALNPAPGQPPRGANELVDVMAAALAAAGTGKPLASHH